MPYFITDQSPDCSGWATVKEDGEVIGCHTTKQDAIDQMVAVSISEGIEPGGERARPNELEVGDYVSWNTSGGRARGEIVQIERDGTINVPDSSFTITGTPDDPAALIQVYQRVEGGWDDTDVYVGHKFSTLTKIDPLPEPMDEDDEDDDEVRQVDLTAPAYMRASARRGLQWYAEGLGGDGLVDRTIREARAMAEGNVSADKWVRIAAWIARHLGDLDSPDANPSSENFPSPGVVAMALWGGGTTKRSARRAMAYAEGVKTRLEAEQERANMKQETRNFDADFELRAEGDGMTFIGYAAKFNSPSEDLGGFVETIEPGAFRRSLRSRNDVKLLVNHDTGRVLASTRSGTMKLYEDEVGLRVEASLPNTSDGRDMAELLRRGDLNKMSFGFSVPKKGDRWSDDGTTRELLDIRLHEVSIVTGFPAYEATTASVRTLEIVASRTNTDPDKLADALLKLESGETLNAENAELITEVVTKLRDDKPLLGSFNNLDIKRKQLDLVYKAL